MGPIDPNAAAVRPWPTVWENQRPPSRAVSFLAWPTPAARAKRQMLAQLAFITRVVRGKRIPRETTGISLQ